MGKRRGKTVPELLRLKFKLLEASELGFIDGLDSVEKEVFKKALELLRNFSQQEGKLVRDGIGNNVLLNIRKELLAIIRNSAFIPRVENFLTDFDEVERLNKAAYSKSLKREVKVNVNLEKKIIIDHVTDSLIKTDSINANYTNLIRKNLTDSVRFGFSFKEAETNLRKLILGQGNGGHLVRYAKQIATDSMNQFDGAVNDVIRDAYLLDGYRYVGSIIQDSRTNCKEWIQGSGKFKKFAIRPGTFRVEDIPAMIKIAKKRKGWNPATTAANFGQFRGGYNCRHQIFYFRLTKEMNDQVESQLAA